MHDSEYRVSAAPRVFLTWCHVFLQGAESGALADLARAATITAMPHETEM